MKPVNLAVVAATVTSAAQTPTLAAGDGELKLFTSRRIVDLAQFPDPAWFSNVSTWLQAQKDDGTWSDVNYQSGCSAQRANWPIQEHWNRIITLASAWSGVNPTVPQKWAHDDNLYKAISKGLDYWFDNDYSPDDCIGYGGSDKHNCPCGTPGLWNSNWYDQSILIPQLCSISCLILKDAPLSESQRAGCQRIPKRAYDLRDGTYGTGGKLTAANVVLVMQNSVSLGLFTDNATITKDAMDRALAAMTFSDEPGQDGIHRDGTFLQHKGILYNGNYGKDLLNAFIQLESEAIGTKFAAKDETREAMSTYIRGDEWLIFVDQKTRRELWDYNAVGRFVSFPTSALQANSDINFNVSKLANATADFTGSFDVSDTIRRLKSNGTEKLTGNKGFWASDYMVHRRDSFMVTNKMLSNRSQNSEGINGANPYPNHLGQGTLFSYVQGDEYKDIMAAWDWNLVPGTTTLLNHPKLGPDTASSHGKKDFVGVVSDGKNGIAVEDYLEPFSGSISYRKAWFHFDDAVVAVTSDIRTTSDAPVITVLDNRAKAPGGILVEGQKVSSGKDISVTGSTLFYGGNGYLSYDQPFNLTVSEGDRTGNWSEISTSNLGLVTVPIFSAYNTISRNSSAYTFFPATGRRTLDKEAKKPTYNPIIKHGVSAVTSPDKLGVVFWPNGPKAIKVDLKDMGWADEGTITISSDQPATYLITSKCKKPGQGMRLAIYAADPTQKLSSIKVSVAVEVAKLKQIRNRNGVSVQDAEATFDIQLPAGGMAGSTVSRDVFLLVG